MGWVCGGFQPKVVVFGQGQELEAPPTSRALCKSDSETLWKNCAMRPRPAPGRRRPNYYTRSVRPAQRLRSSRLIGQVPLVREAQNLTDTPIEWGPTGPMNDLRLRLRYRISSYFGYGSKEGCRVLRKYL
jgi:hypothetical protein